MKPWRTTIALVAVSCGAVEEDRPTLDSIWDKPLDGLSRPEAEIVCREELARIDPCQSVALQQSKEADCSEALASCKAKGMGAPTCQGATLGLPGSCSVSVAEYLACIDDWGATQTCENADKLIPTPPSCQKVAQACVAFAGDFYRAGPTPECESPTGPDPPDTNDDIYGADGCRPIPSRLIVLGDGNASGEGFDPQYSSAALVYEHLKLVSPDLVFESHATAESFVSDLPEQALAVVGGKGHVLVYVFALANDLAAGVIDWPGWQVEFDKVYGHFTDLTKFPDGATFLLNTQYSLYDQCSNPPGPNSGISDEQEQLIQDVNQGVLLDVAIARPDTIAIDHYPDFLGHGQNANIQGCPHCGHDNTLWLGYDYTYPRPIGHLHIAEKWYVAFDAMYAPGCD